MKTDCQPIFAIFGAAADLQPSLYRQQLRVAWQHALSLGIITPQEPRDPYDALLPGISASRILAPRIEARGKVEFAADLLTRPPLTSPLPAATTGANDPIEQVERWVAGLAEWQIPLMLGVDHGLSAAVLRQLSRRYSPARLGLVVLDGHLDAFSDRARRQAWTAMQGLADCSPGDSHEAPATRYGCQSFLSDLVAEGTILPANLIVAGVYRTPDAEFTQAVGGALYTGEYEHLRKGGVTVLERDVLEHSPERLGKALAALSADYLYVSLDLDICASERVPAVRFHDSEGMAPEVLWRLAATINQVHHQQHLHWAGVDCMEMDLHMLNLGEDDAPPDETVSTALHFLETLLADC